MICVGEGRHALYRFYDDRENLLYVGITDDPWRRWREHVRIQPWYPQVKHQAVTWYEGKIAAEVAERIAIRRERPRFNIAGAVRPVADEVSAEPEPELPLPAEPGVADPEPELTESVVRARRRRTMLVLLVCADWAFLPSLPGMPSSWHTMTMKVLVISTVIPVFAFLAIAAAPAISRLGFWLERTFVPQWPEFAPAAPADPQARSES